MGSWNDGNALGDKLKTWLSKDPENVEDLIEAIDILTGGKDDELDELDS